MSSRRSFLLVATIILANGGATCLYSGAGPLDPAAGDLAAAWNPALEIVARALTVPANTPGIADIRDVVLLASLAVLCLLLVLPVSPAGSRPTNGNAGTSPATGSSNPGIRWIARLSTGVVTLGLLSVTANASVDWSWGWIVRFIAGSAWALLIAASFTESMARQTVGGLLVIGAAALGLAIAHRSDRGLAHFTWPIGPITPTSALAAVWAAVAGGMSLVYISRRAHLRTVGLLLAAFALSIYSLVQTGRRGPALALITALMLCGGILLWKRLASRLARRCILAVALVATLGGGLFVTRQATSRQREASWSVLVRLGYWRLCGGLVGEEPVLGVGPDKTVIQLTNRVAPLRAESPWLYEGNFDPTAHNEWLQAIVELGLPGGLLYLALPLGIVYLAGRRLFDREASTEHESLILGPLCGLLAILLIEMSSITLRGPIMPTWYWTLIGLLAASCRPPGQPAIEMALRARRWFAPLLTATAVACGAICATDLSSATAEARIHPSADGNFGPRLFAEKTLSARLKAASLASEVARASAGDASAAAPAARLWKALYDQVPGLGGVCEGYAESLLMSGQEDEAAKVCRLAIERKFDPHGPALNILYARLQGDDPVGQLLCVQRALRNAAMDAELQGILRGCEGDAAVQGFIAEQTPPARAIIEREEAAADSDLSAELLRISAFSFQRRGRMSDAIGDQRRAAVYYRNLELRLDRERRPANAESDAWFRLAMMYYEVGASKYKEAYDAIRQAERYAVLGVRHERVSHPEPELGFVIGEVMPVEFPERLLPLWRLSLILHLVHGDLSYPQIRSGFTLPRSQWNQPAIAAQLERAARQALKDIDRLPPKLRPPNIEQLRQLAQPTRRAVSRRSG